MNIFTQTSSKDFDYLQNFQKTLRFGFNDIFVFSICTMQEVQMSICMHTKMWILFPKVNGMENLELRISYLLEEDQLTSIS